MSWLLLMRMVMNIQTPTSVSGSNIILPGLSIWIFRDLPYVMLSGSRNFHLSRSCYQLRVPLSVLPALLLKSS